MLALFDNAYIIPLPNKRNYIYMVYVVLRLYLLQRMITVYVFSEQI